MVQNKSLPILLVILSVLCFSSLAFATTTVTVGYPNGGQSYNWYLDSQDTIDGNFHITSNDANAFLIDINLSTVNTQGTGYVMQNDVNTFTGLVVTGCSGLRDFNVAGAGRDCNFSIPIEQVVPDGTYFLNISATALTSGYDSSNATISIEFAYVSQTTQTDLGEMIVDILGTFFNFLITWLPLILLVGVGMWAYYTMMKKM